MWKQKLKICGINLTAYSVALIIMVMLSFCFRLYGQENPGLCFDQIKLAVMGTDTTKLSFYEEGRSFLFPQFMGAIPKMPEMLLNFRPDYTLSFPVDRSSLHKGEYSVGGVIHWFDKMNIWGRGRQENFIGVGMSNYAVVQMMYAQNNNWMTIIMASFLTKNEFSNGKSKK